MEKNFVHLHLHTEYSILDGAARIKKVVKTAKKYGMPAIAITDHGNMYGVVKFYEECKKQGIKPILGCEVYITKDLHEKNSSQKHSHLLLLVKNEQGYKNLTKLNSIGFVDGFYYKPRIDYKTLEQYSEGLVVLSGCLGADIPKAILDRRFDEAEEYVQWFKRVFGDDFYIELQNHFLPEQIEVNEKLRELSDKYNIKRVATNDVHYINKEDAEVQDVLMCVQMSKTLDDPNRLKFPTNEFYFKTYEEMASVLPNDLDALANTLEVAEKCNYDYEFGHYLFPEYEVPKGHTVETYLRSIVDKGLKEKYKEVTPEILERMESELAVIKGQGFLGYFLIVWDYINAARQMGISVGPGRGSGAGSIIAYAMGITNIDPLKFDLLFERFLHNERVTAPDFDIDFEDERREEVIDYVKEKYGIDRVIKIVTFGTMAGKMAIKDVGRVLKIPYSQSDKITKLIPNTIKKPEVIKKAFGLYHPEEGDKDYGETYGVPDLIELYESNPEIKRMIDIAIKLEDMPRQPSTHACGVVIGADVLDKHIPLSRNGDDITTQFNMKEVEHLGHLKMDFLGLRNLTDIRKAIIYVKENHGVDIDFDHMEMDDPEVFKLISTGNTKAIFQIESGGFQKFMKELKPTSIEDITAGVSLYRPGPMDSIPRYVHNKHNPEDVVYDHEILEPILDVTYGCIVYQEQVMKIVQDMAGYTLGQADMVRRMMGKKDVAGMAKEEDVFLHGKPAADGKPEILGAVKKGVKLEVAQKVWGEMKSFAQYAFNKSHAAAYSIITYQTAYLKRYYEPEFLTSVLNNRITNIDEIKTYVTHAKEENIEVLQPDINESETYFKATKDGKIRFGLAALKGVGVSVIDAIIAERETNGKFVSIDNFVSRFDNTVLNKRTLESLILSGAFDSFGVYRSQMMRVYPTLLERASHDRKTRASGQYSMFDSVLKEAEVNKIVYPNIAEYDNLNKLKLEREVVGVYISGHPLSNFEHVFKGYSVTSDMLKPHQDEFAEVDDESDDMPAQYGVKEGEEITCGGTVTDVRKFFTKRDNKEMAFVQIEDLYGSIDLMFFANVFAKCKDLLVPDTLVNIKGKVSIREGFAPTIIVDTISKWDTSATQGKQQEEQKPKVLYLKYDLTNQELSSDILKVLSAYPGDAEVIVKCEVQNKPFKLGVTINPNSFMLNELHAYLPDENIVLK